MNLSIGACSLFVSAAILAGCATTPVLEQRLGQALPSDASASYDAVSDTVMLSKGGASVVLQYSIPVGESAYFVKQGGGGLLYKSTVSGKGRVFSFASADTSLGIVGAIASRDAEVTVPANGTAKFNGGYEGLLVRASDKMQVQFVEGTTCLTADFGASSIGGGIINRSNAGADVIIPSTPLTPDGVFSGVATGGANPGETASNGRVSGMFADVSGGEIVGALQLNHSISGNDFYEVGGFTTVAGAGPCP